MFQTCIMQCWNPNVLMCSEIRNNGMASIDKLSKSGLVKRIVIKLLSPARICHFAIIDQVWISGTVLMDIFLLEATRIISF